MASNIFINQPNWDEDDFSTIGLFKAKLSHKSVRELDDSWILHDGSLLECARTIDFIGTYAIVYKDEVVVIGSGTDRNAKGIGTRISKVFHKFTSTNKHYSFRMIRQHIDDVKLATIRLDYSDYHPDDIRKIAGKLKAAYRPAWNAPKVQPLGYRSGK